MFAPGSRFSRVHEKMEAKFQGNFELCDFQSYLQYFEFYINDTVLKRLDNLSSDNKLSGSAEDLQKNIRIMLNTTRRKRQYSDVIVKIHTAKIVSDWRAVVNSLLYLICKSLYHTK